MHNESFYLDLKTIPGNTLNAYTTSILMTIKAHENQFTNIVVGSEVVSSIYDSFKIFMVETEKHMGFYVDYSFENRVDSRCCEVTQVKVSLCL